MGKLLGDLLASSSQPVYVFEDDEGPILVQGAGITRTSTPSTFIEGGANQDVSFHLDVAPIGDVYVQAFTSDLARLDFVGGSLVRFSRYGGGWTDLGIGLPGGTSQPRGLTLTPNLDLLLVDRDADKFYRYSAGSWDDGTDLPSGVNNWQGITQLTNGSIVVVTDQSPERFFVYRHGSWDSGTQTAGTAVVGVGSVNDQIFVLDGNLDRIDEYVGGGNWEIYADLPGAIGSPQGMTINQDGDVFVVDNSDDRVYRYSYNDDTWDEGTDLHNNAIDTRSVAVYPNGDLVIADASDEELFLFTEQGWDAAQSLTLRPREDEGIEDHNITVTLAARSGGYHQVSDAFSVKVTDDEVPALVFSDGAPPFAIFEGVGLSYSMRLNARPTGTVTVTTTSGDPNALAISGGSTRKFTTENWDTDQTIVVTALPDPDVADEFVTVSYAVSGGGFGGADTSHTVSIIDDETPALVLSHDEITVPENFQNVTVHVKLAHQPGGNVVVTVASDDEDVATVSGSRTYTTENWNSNQSFTIHPVDDQDLLTEDTTITFTASGGGYNGTEAELDLTVTDADVPALHFSATPTVVNEGGTAEFDLRLVYIPDDDVTVAVASNDTGALTVSPASLTFTEDNWDTDQTVTVTGAQDSDPHNETVTVSFAATGGGYGTGMVVDDPIEGMYTDQTLETRNVTVIDDDKAIILGAIESSIDEGDSVAFGVSLNTQPTSAVTIFAVSTDPGAVTVSPSVMKFTTENWDTAQQSTLTAVEDSDATDESVAVNYSALGGGFAGLTASHTVNVSDDESVGLIFTSEFSTVREGSTDDFRFCLASEPTANVTVTVTTSDASIASVVGSSFTFNEDNWDTARSTTIRGQEDADELNNTATITFTASGGDYDDVEVEKDITVEDEDFSVIFDGIPSAIIEGTTSLYNIRLSRQPFSDVTVTTSGDNSDVTILGSSRTFTSDNWDTDQVVGLIVAQDTDIADETVTVTTAASGTGMSFADDVREISIQDDDTPGLVVSNTQIAYVEGFNYDFRVRLAEPPTDTVTVTLTSDDTDAANPVTTSRTFTTTNWNANKVFRVSMVQDEDSDNESVDITFSAEDGGYDDVSETVTLDIRDDEGSTLVFTSSPTQVNEGGSAVFSVRLSQKPIAGTPVTAMSSDTGALTVDPPSRTFNPVNWNTPQDFTIKGVQDIDVGDETATVTFTPPSGSGFSAVTKSVTVLDDETLSLKFPTDVSTVPEGSSRTIRVSLPHQPTGNVTVSASSDDTGALTVSPSSRTFSTVNWNTAMSFTLTGVQDAGTGDETVNLTFSLSGGGYGDLDDVVKSITVTDDDSEGLVFTAQPSSVNEGSSATFSVRLGSQPTGNVTLSASSGDTDHATVSPFSRTFTSANYLTAQNFTVTGVQDDDAQDDDVNITFSGSGGGYGDVSVVRTITVDDDDTVGLTFTAAPTEVVEGETAVFSVELSSQPSSPVTITAVSQDTDAMTVSPSTRSFSTANWDDSQDFTITGVHDADGMTETAVLRFTGSGGGYGAAAIDKTVTINDDETLGLAFTTDPTSVTEGSSTTVSVRLTSQPSGNVTLSASSDDTDLLTVSPSSRTFTTSNWNSTQNFTLSGVQDSDATDESVTVTYSASGGGYGDVEVEKAIAVNDDDSPGFNFGESTPVDIAEDGARSFAFSLSTQPTDDVTVSFEASPAVATVSPSSRTFTPSNWNSAQGFVLSGVQDADEDDEDFTLTLTASGGDYDEYEESFSLSVIDEDYSFVISDADASINEGGTDTYNLRLSRQPEGSVEVTTASNDSGAISVTTGATRTFTTSNWDTNQTVTLTGQQDSDSVNETVTITTSADDFITHTRTVVLSDDEVPALTFTSAPTTVTEGSTATISLMPNSEPSSNVTVSASSSNSAIATISPSSRVFSQANWDTAQSFTVTGVQDDDVADESVTFTFSASGAEFADVESTHTMTVEDDDTVGLTFNTSPTTVNEGSSVVFDVRLATQPTGDVTVSAESGDTDALTVTSSRTYTSVNWNTAQSFTAAAQQDANAVDESVSIEFTCSGGGYGDVEEDRTVTITDDDSVALSFSAEPTEVDEGSTATFSVALASEPTGDVTVTATSSDTDALTVSPSSVTFTASNWDTAQNFVATGVEDGGDSDESVNITFDPAGADYAELASVVKAITVNDDDPAPGLTFSATPTTVAEGSTATFSLQLSSPPTGDVAVAVSSNDTGALTVSPASLTFTEDNWDTDQDVTITGQQDNDLADETVTVTFDPSGANYGSASTY